MAIALIVCLVAWILHLQVLRRNYADQLLLARSKQELVDAERKVENVDYGDRSLDLTSLWTLTHKRLDYYHEIATTQARTSFRNAQFAMSIGFGALALCLLISLLARGVASSIVTAVLGAAGATLGGYVARTFLRSQESAAAHLRAYFLQPLEFSRYLVVERLLDTLPDRAKTKGILTLVNGIAGIDADTTEPSPDEASPTTESKPPELST
jgi:hypothetical protein